MGVYAVDEILKALLPQAPAAVVLLYAIKVLYLDMKADRAAAAAERQFILAKLDKQAEELERVANALSRVERACGADLLPPMEKRKNSDPL